MGILKFLWNAILFIGILIVMSPYILARGIIDIAMWAVTWKCAWNWLAPTAFGLEPITYLQAAFAYMLARLLFFNLKKSEGVVVKALEFFQSGKNFEEKKRKMEELMPELPMMCATDMSTFFIAPWFTLLCIYLAKLFFMKIA
jgi:hypothetical protein